MRRARKRRDIMDRGNLAVTDIRDLLASESMYLRLALSRDGDHSVLRYMEAVMGAKPPRWTEEHWEYRSVAFLSAAIGSDNVLEVLDSTSEGRLVVGPYSIAVPQIGDQINWERRPSLASYDIAPLPWPVVDYSLYPRDSDHLPRTPGFLIGDGCPSFPGFETAFRAFFYGDFSTIGAGQIPSDLGRLRHVQPEAWLRRVRVSPTHLEVWVGGKGALGTRVELNSAQLQVSKRVGKSAKIRFPLRQGLPDDVWLYLSREKSWLDYRALGSRLTRSDDLRRSGVEIETTHDPEAEIGSLISGGEGPRTEFKSALPAKTPESMRKVLKTVAAFANAQGGSVVFGMDPDEVTPVGIDGDLTHARDRLTNLIRRHIEPSPPISFRSYDVQGHSFLVLDIDAGSRPPYGLRFQDSPIEFYIRRGANTYPATAEEVREAVLGSLPIQQASPTLPANPW